MTADTIEPDEVLLPLLEPILAFMISHQMNDLHIRAAPATEASERDSQVPFGTDAGVAYCSAEPGHGVQGIYAVTDDKGEGRLDGPSTIPQTVLRPLLKALNDLNVEQLHITKVREAADSTDASRTVVLPAHLTPDEFDEDIAPDSRIVNAVIPFRIEGC